MDTLLYARGLHARCGSSHLLHGVDLRIELGQTVGLLGRNDWPLQRVLQTFLHLHERFDHLGAQLFGGEFRTAGVPRGAA
jgi:predicted ABC-type transport system involved in lysophospholipase L1 biosynthesis ATPase subunit